MKALKLVSQALKELPTVANDVMPLPLVCSQHFLKLIWKSNVSQRFDHYDKSHLLFDRKREFAKSNVSDNNSIEQ